MKLVYYKTQSIHLNIDHGETKSKSKESSKGQQEQKNKKGADDEGRQVVPVAPVQVVPVVPVRVIGIINQISDIRKLTGSEQQLVVRQGAIF
jgi:hypothetical protein